MNDEPKSSLQKARKFLLHDVWDIDLSSLSAGRSLPIQLVRVAQLVVKGFTEDDLAVHASSLTFVTLMSLVPILAVAFALLKGFGFGQDEIGRLLEWKSGMPVEFQTFVDNVLHIVNTTNFAALGWVGLAFVVYTSILVLWSVEISFNRIWGVTTKRGVFRQVANYISILVLVPLLIGIASTVEASLKAQVVLHQDWFGFFLRSLLRLTSLFSTWLAFLFLYKFIPNTFVRLKPAVFSSFIGAVVFVSWQKAYIALQVGVARYNAIYGTFASVPIFLAWLYMSWVIILLGAELAFALQNSATYGMESASDHASAKSRFILALSVILHAAKGLSSGARFETGSYARDQRVPFRLLNEVVRILVGAGWLTGVAEKEGAYVLTKAPDTILVKEIIELVMQEGARPETLGLTSVNPAVDGVLRKLNQGMMQSLDRLTLQDLLKSGKGLETVNG